MSKKLATVIPFLGLLLASNAHAVGLDTNGSSTAKAKPAPVAPATDCATLALYAADTSPDEGHLQRYRFTGECRINIAPAGKTPVLKTVPVLINAEWFPKMKRASESVVIQDPDLGVELSTWATCPRDPFVERNVPCTSPGIGSNKFSAFLRSEDVPFARGRTTASFAKSATSKVGVDANKLYAPVQIAGFQPPGTRTVGAMSSFLIDVTGGIRLCPMRIDFGDGTVERLRVEDDNKGTHIVNHAYAKPGTYKLTARSLPGCTGQSQVTVNVATGKVGSIEPGSAVKVGQTAGIMVHGTGASCAVHIDYGDGGAQDFPKAGFGGVTSSMYLWRIYDKPGTYTVKVNGINGCAGSATRSVEVVL